MADNVLQVGQIIDRLIHGTAGGNVKWDDGVTQYSYQTRFGDFLISLSGPGPSARSSNVAASLIHGANPPRLEIKRLDGRTIVTVGGNSVNIMMNLAYPPEIISRLGSLYDMVSDRSDDLDELLKLMR